MRRFCARLLLAALMVVGIKNVAPSRANDFSTPPSALSPLSLQAAANVLEVEAPFSSPDGGWIVYTIADPSRTERPAYDQELFTSTGKPLQAGGLRLRVVNLASGRTYEINGKQGSTWSPAWSPDSRYLAFFSDRSGSATLWLWDTATQRQRQLSTAIVHSYITELPAWSPDSETVLYKVIPSDMTLLQVLKLNPYYPRARTEPADAEHANVSVYKFAPSKQSIPAASSDSAKNSSTSAMIDRLVLSDLALVEVATGKLHRIAKHVHPWPWYAFSPDGTKVGYMQLMAEIPNSTRNVSDLDVIWLASGKQKALVEHIVANFTGGGASWSPDSSRIAYIAANIGGSERSSTLWVLSVGTGATRKVSGPFDFSYSSYSSLDRLGRLAPLWDADGEHFYSIDDIEGRLLRVAADGTGSMAIPIPGNWLLATLAAADGRRYWSPDGGRSMLLQLRNTTTHSITFCRFDLGTNQCSAVLDDRKNITLGLGPANAQPEALLPYVASDATNPKNVWVTDGGFTFVRQVSNANPAIAAAKLGKLEVVDWMSLTGEHLSGGLLLPANYEEGKRYPLLVAVYGGARGATDTNAFGLYMGGEEFNMQVLASRGFAVLYPDIPIHRERHSPMQDVYEAVIPGIDRVVELGIADSGKVAVMGQSFGGYNTIGLITQTNRFAAAVATSPAWPNLFEGYATFKDGVSMQIGIFEETQINMGCHPWECRDRYLENSPFFFLDKVTTPLLMERGTDDDISVQNGEIFVGLRRLGKEVMLLEYAHEGHVLETPANIVDFWERTLEFLDAHLGVSSTK
jgi:dipeptidyl aminopeptidase/acylaminoacyl peptidase